MNKKTIATFLVALLLTVQAASAQYFPPPPTGGSGGVAPTDIPITSVAVLSDFDGNDSVQLQNSPDGKFLYVSGVSILTGKVLIAKLSIPDGAVVSTLNFNTLVQADLKAAGSANIVVSPDGTKIFGGTNNGSVFSLNTTGLALIHDTVSTYARVNSLTVTPDGTKVVAGLFDGATTNGYAMVFNATTLAASPVINTAQYVQAIACDADNINFYISGSTAATIKKYALSGGAASATYNITTGAGTLFAVKPSGAVTRLIAESATTAATYVVNTSGGATLSTIASIDGNSVVYSSAFGTGHQGTDAAGAPIPVYGLDGHDNAYSITINTDGSVSVLTIPAVQLSTLNISAAVRYAIYGASPILYGVEASAYYPALVLTAQSIDLSTVTNSNPFVPMTFVTSFPYQVLTTDKMVMVDKGTGGNMILPLASSVPKGYTVVIQTPNKTQSPMSLWCFGGSSDTLWDSSNHQTVANTYPFGQGYKMYGPTSLVVQSDNVSKWYINQSACNLLPDNGDYYSVLSTDNNGISIYSHTCLIGTGSKNSSNDAQALSHTDPSALDIDTSGGAFGMTLADPTGVTSGNFLEGKEFLFVKKTSDANAFTLTANVDGAATNILSKQWDRLHIKGVNGKWHITSSNLAPPVVITGTTDTVPLTVKGASGQTSDLIRVTDAAGNIFFQEGADGQVHFGNGLYSQASISNNGTLVISGDAVPQGQVKLLTPGVGVLFKGGANCRVGTGTLVGGTVTISNTSVTANSYIFLQDTGGGVNFGTLEVTSQTASTGFTVTSSNALDTSSFKYVIFETQ